MTEYWVIFVRKSRSWNDMVNFVLLNNMYINIGIISFAWLSSHYHSGNSFKEDKIIIA
jgi:hypothetical protein